ncbi:hypothetical protein M758_9G031400 [Ceratodon purpureus]|nr:hypothetical protein M758_9G031400 [Ceratodon purpureus]
MAFQKDKMPELMTRTEGFGDDVKTIIVNVKEVAEALGRPPASIMVFFGCRLDVVSVFDKKALIGILQGQHNTTKLALVLEDFINKFVRCNGCKKFKTHVAVTTTGLVTLECTACGYLSAVDMGDERMMKIQKMKGRMRKQKMTTTWNGR